MERRELESLFKNDLLKVKVLPNSSTTGISEYDPSKEELKIKLNAPPEKGKANQELITFFKKIYKIDIEIVKGHSNRNKIIRKKKTL
ncbi:DUF167 domain-containing protein [Candidatus Woesearchaeota archaeon]|nr:DUF167 domain-containing protein [Candidatus Woesearchaeota archaeon]